MHNVYCLVLPGSPAMSPLPWLLLWTSWALMEHCKYFTLLHYTVDTQQHNCGSVQQTGDLLPRFLHIYECRSCDIVHVCESLKLSRTSSMGSATLKKRAGRRREASVLRLWFPCCCDIGVLAGHNCAV